MALSDGEFAVLSRLESRLRRDTVGSASGDRSQVRLGFGHLDAYYNGRQRLEQLGLAVPPELRRFITVVNWPRVVVDAVEERIDLEGFRLPGAPDADEELWRVWQANDLDEESQLAHLDALVFGRSFVCVGSNDEDETTPLVTVESPLGMAVERDPRSRRLSAAAKFYTDESADEPVRRATLYLPDVTVWLVAGKGRDPWVEDTDGTPGRDEHRLGRVPVVALTNRARLDERAGQSHMLDAIDLTDASARALTNAQVAAELMAIPQRWAVGLSRGDFVDEHDVPLTVWESYFGAISMSENKDAKFGQFGAADLSNFKTIIDEYAQLLTGMYGLPLRYMGQMTSAPPSAEALRADEARLVKTCERKERSFGGSWEQVMRLVRRVADGESDPSLVSMETLWRDPSTPTRAQAADAAIKLHQDGILSAEGAREAIGMSAVQRAKEAERLRSEGADPLAAQFLAGLPADSQAAAPAAPVEPLPSPVLV